MENVDLEGSLDASQTPAMDEDLAAILGDMDEQIFDEFDEQTSDEDSSTDEETNSESDDILKELSGEETEEETSDSNSETVEDSEIAKIEFDGQEYEVPKALEDKFMMQQDYTRKTQEIAEDRKAFDEEYVEAKTNLENAYTEFNEQKAQAQEKLTNYDKWNSVIAKIQSSDPGLFEDINGYWEDTEREYNNPVNVQMREQLAVLQEQQANSTKAYEAREIELSDQKILNGFDNEFSKLADTVAQMDKLGIKVNEDDVLDVWGDGESSNMTVKQALHALYGESLTKLSTSKAKVANVKKRAHRGQPGLRTGGARGSESKGLKGEDLNTYDTAIEFAKELGYI